MAKAKTDDERWGFHRRHPRLTRLALVLVSLLAADLVAGWIGIDRARMGFRRPHPYYHHDLVPDREALAQWGPRPPYPIKTNSLGFLDSQVREVPLESEGRRVVLLGDSFTEGIGLPFELTFAGMLQRRLAASGIELLNAAALSYSPHLYYLKTRYLLEEVGLDFDELCVFVDISDVQDEVLYRAFEPRLPGPADDLLQRVRRAVLGHSFLAHGLDEWIEGASRRKRRSEYNAQSYPPWLDYFWMDNQDWTPHRDPEFAHIRSDWTTERLLGNPWTQEGLALAREHMDLLVQLCREHAVELTVVVYPWPTQIARLERDCPQSAIWRAFCAERDVPLLDLFDDFVPATQEEAARVYARYFIPGDVHWSPAGHELVAARVAPYLAQ